MDWCCLAAVPDAGRDKIKCIKITLEYPVPTKLLKQLSVVTGYSRVYYIHNIYLSAHGTDARRRAPVRDKNCFYPYINGANKRKIA